MKQFLFFVASLLVLRSEVLARTPRPEVPGQPARPVVVTTFGAAPDSRKDATAAFQRAIGACKQRTNPILIIPHGRYDLYPDSAIKKTYFISNTSSETECPSKLKTIGLLFEGIRNLRVEGDGSLLVFHGKMTTIVVDHCDNFTLANLTEDFARPTMSEFTVTGASNTAIDVNVHPDSWHRIDSGRLTWYGEDWVAKDHFCIRVDTTHAFVYANDAYDQLLHSTVTEPAPGSLHWSGAFDRSLFPVGSVFTVRDPLRDEVGAFLVNSQHIRWENISMHYMHGLGIIAQFSEDIAMHKVRIEPAAGSGRMIASFADGMHFSCCKGTLSVDSCRFDGLHDDAINVHGVHLRIVSKRSTHQLVLRYMHPQTYGFMAYYPGDSIAFVHPRTLAIYQYAVVRSAEMISPREILVSLTRPVPAEALLTDVIENITWTPRVFIHHCYVAGTETRGFLLTTRRKTVIEDNTFSRLGMSAILVADDGLSWYESGQVHDLTIRHNLFRECGNNLFPANYTLAIAPENQQPDNPQPKNDQPENHQPENHQPAQTAVHSNIHITGNHFICNTPAVLTARSVDGLVFSGNSIEQTPYFQANRPVPAARPDPAASQPVKALDLIACHHVTIKDNRYGPAREKREGAMPGAATRGAVLPWTTYEAEHMHTTGIVMGPTYDPYLVETESSGQQCVKLEARGQSIEFVSTANAQTIVIRYSLPDNNNGNGTTSTLGVYTNGKLLQQHKISSHYAWLYGKYPFTNDPAAGKPRHFYDELRLTGFKIVKGDVIRIERDDHMDDDAGYCIIDLVDLENPAPPLKAPLNSLSIADKRFLGDHFTDDYTEAFRKCIAKAVETGKTVWIPAGTFKITGDIILPANVTVEGAGMWYSQLVGDDSLYTDANRRVRLKGDGSNIHLADFAIIGKLNYRVDNESNDGIVGSFGTNSTIARIWIEHTKVGMWIENSMNLTITACRMRNTLADGINFCVGMAHSTIENCTARGTGDDCFAIWPTVSQAIKQTFPPGHNLIIHCSGTLPYLANGGAIYGGDSNEIRECSFTDISQGSAILVSTTFPTESKDKIINNNFSGTTIIRDCDITTSGGFDHDWDWRAAVELCLDRRSIAGIEISDVHIENSFSNGLSVIAKNEPGKTGILSNVILQNVSISNSGLGVQGKHDLFISSDAHGSLVIKRSNIPDSKNESDNFRLLPI